MNNTLTWIYRVIVLALLGYIVVNINSVSRSANCDIPDLDKFRNASGTIDMQKLWDGLDNFDKYFNNNSGDTNIDQSTLEAHYKKYFKE